MDLLTVAAELYTLLPSDFVAARNQRAKTAGQSGEKDLAQQIRRLPKPSTSAWLVNLLVTRQRQTLEPLLELGASMRQAQQELNQQRLKQLGLERSRLIATIQRECRRLAEELGHPVSDSAAAELEQTLRAAIADAAAADAVVSGRLTRSVESTGWDPVDLTDAVAAPGTAQHFPAPAERISHERRSADHQQRKPSASKKRARRSGADGRGTCPPGRAEVAEVTEAETDADGAAEAERAAQAEAERAAQAARRDRRAKAEVQLDDAERDAEQAEQAHQKTVKNLAEAQSRREHVAAEIEELRTRLAALERKAAAAAREADSLARECDTAGRSAERARRDAARARARVEKLS